MSVLWREVVWIGRTALRVTRLASRDERIRFYVRDPRHEHNWYVTRDHADPTGWRCACRPGPCEHRTAVVQAVERRNET